MNCLNPIETFRFVGPSSFHVKYYFNSLNSNNRSNTITMTDETVYFVEYLVDQSSNGGTIYVSLVNSLYNVNKSAALVDATNQIQSIHACVLFNSRDFKRCKDGFKLVANSTTFGSIENLQLNIPYPMMGKWYLAIWKQCYDSQKK